ncbi:F-box protein CPR1-like [Arachis stenosperma]|uniref:F-box protein CPR1-like n=1 Tax=Arachis stenosperma TaxID=217475 RepID=UPI0025ACE8CC|nr:F-box protein CPR1-like [Arachis stenosperma]
MEKKQKSIHDILPHDLIHTILLKVPAKNIVRLKCVSKLWYSLISDPHFAELHFQYSPTATNAFIFTTNCIQAYLALFIEDNYGARLKVVYPPFKNKTDFKVLGSCRGYVLLHGNPHFLVVWNPLTGSNKRIPYSHIVSRCKHKGVSLPCKFHLYGFGYDASQDDFLVVVAWQDKDDHYHFDCVSLRTNSLINLDAALPKSLGLMEWQPHGLLLNGAIHWLPLSLKTYRDTILIFDLKERTFSMISAPEQPEMSACSYSSLALLGGCLALYYPNNDSCNTHIWVMKEYKVHSSWTLYQIPCVNFQPLCLSSNGNIIGRGYISNDKVDYLIYIVRGDLVKHIKNLPCQLPFHETVTVYTESFLSLPTDIKNKDNRPSESERCQTKKEN